MNYPTAKMLVQAIALSLLVATQSNADVKLPEVSKPGTGAVLSGELIY